jgi:toxin YoeB
MSYDVDFADDAKSNLNFHKKSGNKAILKKITSFREQIAEHSFSGTGKHEPLQHDLSGKCFHRINQERRLVYEVLNAVVTMHSAKVHYE